MGKVVDVFWFCITTCWICLYLYWKNRAWPTAKFCSLKQISGQEDISMYMHVRAVFNPSKGGVHTSRKGVYSFIPGVRLNIPTPLVQQVKRTSSTCFRKAIMSSSYQAIRWQEPEGNAGLYSFFSLELKLHYFKNDTWEIPGLQSALNGKGQYMAPIMDLTLVIETCWGFLCCFMG